MARPIVESRFWNNSSLLTFSRPDHAAWPDVLRGAVVTAALGWLVLACNAPRSLIPITLGATFTAIAETGPGSDHPWETMAWSSLGLALGAGLGAVVAENAALAVLMSGAMGWICTWIAAHNARTALSGLLTLVVFTIYVGYPGPTEAVLAQMSLILLGSWVQTLACIVVRSVTKRRHHPRGPGPRLIDIGQWQSSLHLRHGIRLAITLMAATALSESSGWAHQYWLPMSVAWMSKVNLNGTSRRVLHRLLGTLLGLSGIGFLAHEMKLQGDAWLPVSVLGAGMLIAYIWVHYATAVIGVTLYVVAAFAMVGDPVDDTIIKRMLDTTMAAALVTSAAWIDERLQKASRDRI